MDDSPRPSRNRRPSIRSTWSSASGRASGRAPSWPPSPSRPACRGWRRSCNNAWNVPRRGSISIGGSSWCWPRLRGAGPPFRMSPRELHRLLLLSPAAVTNRLYRLEAKGLIERTSDPADRRSLPVILTVQGLSTVDRAMAACVDAERDLLAGVDADDLETTLRTMRHVADRVRGVPDQTTEAARRRSGRGGCARSRPRTSSRPPRPPDPSRSRHSSRTGRPTRRDLERLQRKLARHADEAEPWRWSGEGEPAIGARLRLAPEQPLQGPQQRHRVGGRRRHGRAQHRGDRDGDAEAGAAVSARLPRVHRRADPGGCGARALAAAGHHPRQRGGPRSHPRRRARDPARLGRWACRRWG